VSYQVFARKYRPKTFADVLGQDHVVRTLRNAIAQNRLAHAYLFVGPRGTGKTSTARIFAKALNCPNGPSVDFDPDDEICREIAEGRSLDVLEIDGASNNGVDQVRELRESVKYAPAKSRFKIYYIDEVHMLSTAAFNALLKTLEEPPPHVKFIFATTEANKILPTIISRCQRFDLRRIPNSIIAKHLLHIAHLEGVDLEEKAAFAIGKGAEGGMRDAQSMLDQLVAFCGNTIREQDVLDIFGFTSVETVTQLARHILDRDNISALRLVHETSEAGKDLGRLLGDLIQHVRTLLVCQADQEAASEDLEPDIAAQVQEQSQMATTEQLLRVVDGLAEVDSRMRWATNKRLHLELGVIQAIQHLNEVSLSDVIEALDGGGTASPTAPRPALRPAPPVQEARRAAAPPPASTAAPARVITAPPPRAEAADAPPPAPAARVPEPPPQPQTTLSSPAPTPAAEPAEWSPEDLWQKVKEELHLKRPLLDMWAAQATALSLNKNILKLGFPTTETLCRDSLMRDTNRQLLEAIASEIRGASTKYEMVLDPSLKPPPASEVELFGFGEPAPAPPPALEPKLDTRAEKTAVDTPKTAAGTEAVSPEDFLNDPLIKSAIEQFKLKIAGVS
jgi:DNA polymerase-3 subunit gamma/tau